MHQDYEALTQITGLRDQIKNLVGGNLPAPLKTALVSLDASLEVMVPGGPTRRSARMSGSGPNLRGLNGELARVFEIIEGSDNAPTTQAAAAVKDLQEMWDVQARAWKQLQTDQMKTVNDRLSQAHLPILVLRSEQARVAGSNSFDKDADADVP